MFHRRTELCKAITIYIVRFHGGSHIKWTSLIWNNHTDRFQDFNGKAHNNNTTTAEKLEKNILCRFQIIKRIWHKKVMWCDILPNIDFFCCCCSTKSKKKKKKRMKGPLDENSQIRTDIYRLRPRLYEMFAPLAASCFVSATLCAVGETLKSLLSESTWPDLAG